jgi:WD40 repeat protein
MTIQKLKIVCALALGVALVGGNAALLVGSAPGGPAAAGRAPGAAGRPPQRAALPAHAEARLGSTRLRHGDVIHFLGFVGGGRRLVTAGQDQTIRLWDLEAGTEVRRFERPLPPRSPADVADPGGKKPAVKAPAPGMVGGAGEPPVSFRVALSKDARLVAANRGGAAHVWDVATGKLLHTFQGDEPADIADLQFGEDGRTLVTVGVDRVVTHWDLEKKKSTHRLNVPPGGTPRKPVAGRLALAPGGRYLACENVDVDAQAALLKVQELAGGKQVGEAKLPLGGARGLTFAPDGKTLAWTSFDGTIRVWDCTRRAEPRLLESGPSDMPGHVDVESLAFAPDGKTLGACRSDQTVQLWDVAAGTRVRQVGKPPEQPPRRARVLIRLGSGAAPVELAFTPDGKAFACSLGGALVQRFETASGKEIAPPDVGHTGPVTHIHLSAAGKTLITAAPNDVGHVWDLTTGRETRQIPLPRDAAQVVLSAGGRYFASASGGQVTVQDSTDGREVGRFSAGGRGTRVLAVSADGKTVATPGRREEEIHLWDLETGRWRHTLSATPADEPSANARMLVRTEVGGVLSQEVVFSPDGRYLAGAGPRRQLCLWDAASGKTVWEKEVPSDQVVERFAFTSGSLALAAVNRDSTVSLYETATGELHCRLGRADRSRPAPPAVRIGDSPAMLLVPTRQTPPSASVASGPSGRFLAAASGEPVIHLWDLVTGQEVGRFQGHQGNLVGLAFSADGSRLVSGSLDTTALVWDVSKHTRAPRPESAPLAARDLEALWADLADKDAARAFAAQQTLGRHPAQAAALVRERLPAALGVDPGRLAKLVADLSGRGLATRQKAVAGLKELGEQARPALEKALAGDVSLEVRQRIERLLRDVTASPAGGRLRELRAVETLALAGGPEAREALVALAKGAPEARLTREARAALDGLNRISPILSGV